MRLFFCSAETAQVAVTNIFPTLITGILENWESVEANVEKMKVLIGK